MDCSSESARLANVYGTPQGTYPRKVRRRNHEGDKPAT